MKRFYTILIITLVFCINLHGQWVNQMGAVASHSNSVTTDPDGNVLVIGDFQDRIQIDTATILTSFGSSDVFVAKFNPVGALLWANNMGDISADIGYGISTDINGNVFITGSFSGTAFFDSTTSIVSNGVDDVFLAKYDPDGNLVWVHNIGGTASDFGSDIAIDSNGDILLTGHFSGSASFDDSFKLNSNGSWDAFVAKYNSDGILDWAQKIGGPSLEEGLGIARNADNEISVTGYFVGTVHFDSTTSLTGETAGFRNGYVAKYSPNGAVLWANKMTSENNTKGYDLSADADGNIFVTGSFAGTAKFDSTTTLLSEGGVDAFVAKYGSDGILHDLIQVGSTGSDEGYAITIDSNRNILITGYFEGTANFDASTTLTSTGQANTFIAKYNNSEDLDWVNHVSATFTSLGNGAALDADDNIVLAGSFHGLAEFNETTSLISLGSQPDAFIVKYRSDGSLVTAFDDRFLTNNPKEFLLSQNYPNPFNPTTTINYNIPHTEKVSLTIYDLLGKKIATLVDGIQQAGNHQVSWNAFSASSGIYIYNIQAGKRIATKRMVLLR